jgi:hypothetical protein
MTAKARAATIECKEDTDCAVMDKKGYEKVIGKAFRKKMQERVDFLKMFGVFSHLNEVSL